MIKLLTRFLTAFYAVIDYGNTIERTMSDKVVRLEKEVGGSKYLFRSWSVMYSVGNVIPWLPSKRHYGIMVQVVIVDNLTKETRHLGTKEYPLFVPDFMHDAFWAHAIARIQYMEDVGKYMGQMRNSDRI